MNDHAGWTPDLKCVLCGSDDPGEPCTGLPEKSEKTGKDSILEAEDERILAEMQDIVSSGLNVQKELSNLQSQLLADEIHKFEAEIIKQLQEVKEYIAKGCEKYISDHKCAGVVPGTFIICGEDDYQYCSEACLEIAKRSKELK